MKKFLTSMMAVLLALVLVVPGGATKVSAAEDYTGKTVILHTNDVHGAVEGYTYIAALKAAYEEAGAEVILADAGDFSQGTIYVSVSKGANAVDMMNEVGYDVVALGNHEFDFGYEQLVENLSTAEFTVVCSDIFENGETIFDANTIIETASGLKVGFFGMDTPETQTKVNPGLISMLTFATGDDFFAAAQAQVDALKADGADVIICLAHLGVDGESAPYRSYDLNEKVTGIDFIIDGHSHTVMDKGENGEAIQSTGTKFANVGVVVIDNATAKVEANCLCEITEESLKDETADAKATALIAEMDATYATKFAESTVDLCGDKAPGNRNQETNLGDLITDAMVWQVMKDPSALTVDADHVVGITNGGGIRAWIYAGDITMKDINTVLPFGNTIAVVYVKGAELLEALEASTYCTPEAVGGFPQVSGIDFTVDATKAFDANAETYPDSTYYGPASINRVTINSINGKDFAADDVYAVITNNFCAAGGDTYYAFKAASDQFDTSIPMDEAVMNYIAEELNGVVGETYAPVTGENATRCTVIAPAVEEVEGEAVETLPATGVASAVAFYAIGSVLMGAGFVATKKNRKEQ